MTRWALGALLLGYCLLADPGAGPTAREVVFADRFSLDHLDDAKWTRTRCHDFQEEVVDLAEGRLRMAAATTGTDDATVKLHGVRSAAPVVDLSRPVEIAFALDWNNQANGCYMAAGAYLCPEAVDDPREAESWLRVLTIGVPPRRNARCLISAKRGGREEQLLTEGWPEQREGRRIGVQRLRLTLDHGRLTVAENDASVLEVDALQLGFDRAYLYLQHSSHSNYPRREVFFDDVQVSR